VNSDYGGYGNYFNNEPGAKWQMETRKNKNQIPLDESQEVGQSHIY
jgi:hypothetical protein